MIIEKCVCDICMEEIPIVKKIDPFGNEVEVYRLGKVRLDNTYENMSINRLFGAHICERCAAQISTEMLDAKMKLLYGNQ